MLLLKPIKVFCFVFFFYTSFRLLPVSWIEHLQCSSHRVSLFLSPGDYAGFPGCGLLRLHSTYRHDLKIYASDEGRVQMTAAAFAKVSSPSSGPQTEPFGASPPPHCAKPSTCLNVGAGSTGSGRRADPHPGPDGEER